ncbi:unnamed protein product [Durusdinium trenchii]|uniref:PPPDE domain-containing protein n=1 Tax=Durusdinium trenchii TaxID=1381693 RepID=A0ABP0NW24_9DINO
MSWFRWLVEAQDEEEASIAQLGNKRRPGRPVRSCNPSIPTPSPPQYEASPTLARSLKVATLPGRPQAERVFVRVYDLGKTFLTRWPNMLARDYGAFHSGVEVYGMEWSFGMTLDSWSTGVAANVPGHHPDHTFRETLSMGCTNLSQGQVAEVLKDMTAEWKGRTYDVLTRNCHHFSDELCRRLGVAPLPPWVNQLAGGAASAAGVIEGVSASTGKVASDVAWLFTSAAGGVYSLVAPSRDNRSEEPTETWQRRDLGDFELVRSGRR